MKNTGNKKVVQKTPKIVKNTLFHKKLFLTFNYYWGIIRRSFRKIIGFFILSFLSAFVLFIAVLAPATFKNYEDNSLSNYNYGSYVTYNTAPINSITFNRDMHAAPYGSTGAPQQLHGIFSNHIATANYNLKSDVDRHQFLIQKLRNLEAISPEKGGNVDVFKKALTDFFGNDISSGRFAWLGGTITSKEWIDLLNKVFTVPDPHCFQPNAPAQYKCTFDSLALFLSIIAKPIGLHLAFVVNNDTDKKIDFSKFPVDTTLIPAITDKLTIAGQEFYAITESQLKTYGNQVTPIKGLGDAITRALYDFAPSFVANSVTKQKSFYLTYNMVAYNRTDNSKFTRLNGNDNVSSMWGLSSNGLKNNNPILTGLNNKNLLSLLDKKASGTSNDPFHVVINRSYQFAHHLKTGDFFNYNMSFPVLQERSSTTASWKAVTDFNSFDVKNETGTPALYLTIDGQEVDVPQLVADKKLRIANVSKAIACKVAGVSKDSGKQRVFTSISNINSYMWNSIGISQPSYSLLHGQAASIGSNQYFNGKFSKRDVPLDVNNFELSQDFGAYTQNGLQGGQKYQKYGQGIINVVFSSSAAKKSFGNFASLVTILIAVIASLLTIFSIIFISLSINIILDDNRRTILMYKTFGYSSREIANRFINFYFFVILLAFLSAIPASYFASVEILGVVSAAVNVYIPVYLTWWIPIITFVAAVVILVINYAITYSYVSNLNLAKEWRT